MTPNHESIMTTNQASLPTTPQAPPARRAPPPVLANGPAAAKAPTGPRLSLGDAKRGVTKDEPLSLLTHGVEGVGKSTLAANAPRCLMLCAEDGTGEIPVFGRLSPRTWPELLGVIDDLANETHEYLSLGIDSLDWVEPMLWRHVCEQGGRENMRAFPHGAGYATALDEWRILVSKMRALQEKKKTNIILIAHSILKPFKNPNGEEADYDRWTLKLNDKAAAVMKEWAKAVLFLQYDRGVVEVDGRFKGVDNDGKRLIYTRMTAAYDAKNRLWLPEKIPLSWAALSAAIKDGDKLRAQWDEALWRLNDKAREDAQAWIESVSFDHGKVAKMIDEMRAAQAK